MEPRVKRFRPTMRPIMSPRTIERTNATTSSQQVSPTAADDLFFSRQLKEGDNDARRRSDEQRVAEAPRGEVPDPERGRQ